MKRFVAVVVIVALCAGLVWVRGETAEARTRLGQDISICATPSEGARAIQACADLLSREGLEPRARGVLFYHTGNAQIQMGRFEPALASLEKAADLAPTDPIAPVALSSVFLGLGQHDRSIEEAHAALKRWPSMPKPLQSEALRNIALGHEALGQPREQLSALDDFIAAFPSDPAGLRHRARLLEDHAGALGRPDAIYAQLADLNQAIALEPTHWQSYESRAKLLDRLGMTAVAKSETARALKALLEHGDDTGPIAGAHRDQIKTRYLTALAAHAASVKTLNGLAAEFALDAQALQLRARAHFMQGRLDAAVADMDALTKLRPDYSKFGQELARYHRIRAALQNTDLTAG